MTHIWPLGGGKGGSGKTFLTASLGVALARQGYRTLLVDLDLGAANLHTMAAVHEPERCLSDFVHRRVERLEDAVLETPVRGLFLLSGARNTLDIANLAHEQKMRMIRAIGRLAYDFLLLDLGAGTAFNTIDFFLVADTGIFVTTPEPTSIENVYRLIRSVYFRKIRQILKVQNFRSLAEEAARRKREAVTSNPEYLLALVKSLDPDQGRELEEAFRAFQFKLVLNQLRKQDNPLIGPLVCKVVGKHLGLRMEFAGNVSFDERVHQAICSRAIFLDKYPYTQTAVELQTFCRHLLQTAQQTLPARESGRNG